MTINHSYTTPPASEALPEAGLGNFNERGQRNPIKVVIGAHWSSVRVCITAPTPPRRGSLSPAGRSPLFGPGEPDPTWFDITASISFLGGARAECQLAWPHEMFSSGRLALAINT
ncbi:hypothetical protein MNBD_ACTINO02-2804, partial [hydrothermal vent metagenome]